MQFPYVSIRDGKIDIDGQRFSDQNLAAQYLADRMIEKDVSSYLNSSSVFYPEEDGLYNFSFDAFDEKVMELFEKSWLC